MASNKISIGVRSFDFDMPEAIIRDMQGALRAPAMYVRIPIEQVDLDLMPPRLVIDVEDVQVVFSYNRETSTLPVTPGSGSTPDTEPLSDFENGAVSDIEQASPSLLR